MYLWYWKQSIRWGDTEAAEKWMKKYGEAGGTYKGLRASLRLSAPIGGISRKHRRGFFETLNPDDKKALELANKWYQNTMKGL